MSGPRHVPSSSSSSSPLLCPIVLGDDGTKCISGGNASSIIEAHKIFASPAFCNSPTIPRNPLFRGNAPPHLSHLFLSPLNCIAESGGGGGGGGRLTTTMVPNRKIITNRIWDLPKSSSTFGKRIYDYSVVYRGCASSTTTDRHCRRTSSTVTPVKGCSRSASERTFSGNEEFTCPFEFTVQLPIGSIPGRGFQSGLAWTPLPVAQWH